MLVDKPHMCERTPGSFTFILNSIVLRPLTYNIASMPSDHLVFPHLVFSSI